MSFGNIKSNILTAGCWANNPKVHNNDKKKSTKEDTDWRSALFVKLNVKVKPLTPREMICTPVRRKSVSNGGKCSDAERKQSTEKCSRAFAKNTIATAFKPSKSHRLTDRVELSCGGRVSGPKTFCEYRANSHTLSHFHAYASLSAHAVKALTKSLPLSRGGGELSHGQLHKKKHIYGELGDLERGRERATQRKCRVAGKALCESGKLQSRGFYSLSGRSLSRAHISSDEPFTHTLEPRLCPSALIFINFRGAGGSGTCLLSPLDVPDIYPNCMIERDVLSDFERTVYFK